MRQPVNHDYLQKSRERLGLPPDMLADASAERLAALTGMTRAELRACLELCIARLNAKRIDPGASDTCHTWKLREILLRRRHCSGA